MTVPPPSRAAKDIPQLGYGDYLRFSKLVEDRFGLHFPEKRRPDLERGVRQAFASSTCVDLEEYYHLLQDAKDGAVEMDRLINALTISETYFFRDKGQFDALHNHVLPHIIERRRPLRTLRVWSAGCASGEEPYSIAIMLRELLPDVDDWSITILGTDVNTETLDRARKAVYGDWSFREERARLGRPHYFRQRGNRYQLIPEVQRMVTFDWLNLAEAGYPSFETNTTYMDLILCRNVTIYFSQATISEVVDRFYDALVDGGWLVVGHSEPSLTTYHRFQARSFPNTVLYQRTGKPSALPLEWTQLPSPQTVDATPPRATPIFTPAHVLPKTQCMATTRPDLRALPSQPEQKDPFERAQELMSYGQSEKARALLLEFVQTRANHAPACALLGQAYANLSCWQEAESWCRKAIGLDTLSLEAYYILALVLQHQGRLEEAIAAMKKVVYIDRHHVLGHFGLAELYRSQGQLPQALKSLDNTHRLLAKRADAEVISGSGGITAGRLREAVVRQQQQWSVECEM
jgi:chemotaxis protein methyltransferase CheR